MARHDFASDNTAPAMPEVMAALAAANQGFIPSYGGDPVCRAAADAIRALLDVDATVRFASSGTAANALTLAALAAPHEAVVCHQHSHIATDETGAPAFFGGGLGMIPLPGASGRIDLDAAAAALARPDDPHTQAPGAISFTQVTEYGALYSEAELKALIEAAKAQGVAVHLDGARLANAIAAGFDPKALGRLGVDVAILGGTKAGSTPTEAMVLLNPALARRFGARMKHGGQLVSKGRFLAAPWLGLLGEGTPWIAGAAHAGAMARRLAALSPFPITHPVEANAVFVEMDEPALQRLHAAGWFAWRFIDGSVRFMCSWATTAEAVDELGAVLKSVA